MRQRWRTFLAGALVAVMAGCTSDQGSSDGPAASPAPSGDSGGGGSATQPSGDNPLAGQTLFVNTANPAVSQVAAWEKDKRTADATELKKIGERPNAEWLAGGGTGVGARVDDLLGKAAAKKQLPVLVAYNVPDRDCGQYSAGGAGSADEYRQWIRSFAGGIKGRPAVVILEPDAVAHTLEGCADNATERYAVITDAVNVLKAAGARVYVDAGHPNWIGDVNKLAGALKNAGIAKADGFSLNVSNFVRTADNVTYGDKLSDALGGKTRYVIDTSRNGAGPYDGGTTVNGGPSWCNPPGRALGEAPTVRTGKERVDAFLWVKRPGESDGACRPGEPPAGTWWPEYALELAKRSR
ncbi:glucanase [Virgisporangium aliadipatigenens]|uniref:Glucanase n=1 Tax=Virgisporangium aliadipatigenens TaxID=741659 RepID=A0A8J4DSD5_9ACTN|nr:glycoside hydrolase family 6 protein [Virgisporangium aliadipatigenens]GIJ49120.1 glucanase [Virgisporangium aliadipatigenens]